MSSTTVSLAMRDGVVGAVPEAAPGFRDRGCGPDRGNVIALPLPEMIILHKVLMLRLIATSVAVVSTGILLVGFVSNAVL